MKVLTTPEVRQYFKELSHILYKKDYFGCLEYAERYVEDLFFDIKTNLPVRLHKSAPEYFDKYGKGMYYASFRKNKQTTWYAFFTKYNENGDTVYLVRYIANNHTVAQHL
jgi:hypothetical protein